MEFSTDPSLGRRTGVAGLSSRLRPLVMMLVVLGLPACGWIIARGYRTNSTVFFFEGLAALFVVLILAKQLSRGLILQNAANTFLLLILLVVGAEGVHKVRNLDPWELPTMDRAYSFEKARGDPRLFRNWWDHFARQWGKFSQKIKIQDPRHRLPFKLKPNSEMMFAYSRLHINSLGFRGPEFPVRKGNRYRIVALGESTTMGITLDPDDKPWPRLLERTISDRLKTKRPVQVINAGVAAYTLEHSLVRLREDVLPLKPDLLVSYHGYNGFDFIRGPKVILQEPAPVLPERPSHLLARVEYVWKLHRFRARNFQPDPDPEEVERLTAAAMESRYAKLYRELIAIAQERHIPLLLVGFDMAVNATSPLDVVEFYRGGFPGVNYDIHANRIHNYMIRKLAEENDGVFFIGPSTDLDGVHQQYIDLVHFTQSGRERLAEDIFEGLVPVLTGDPRLKAELRDPKPAGG